MHYFTYDENQTASPLRMFTLKDLIATIWRGRWFIVLCTLMALAIAGAWLVLATPTYVATARILIDPRQIDPLRAGTLDRSYSDMLVVDTQLEILSSRELAEVAMKELADSGTPPPAERPSLIGTITGWVRDLLQGAAEPLTPEQVHNRQVDEFARKVSASRLNLTYAIAVSFTDADPQYAARAANAMANAYLSDQWQAQSNAADKTQKWVNEQIATARAEVLAADQKAENFRIAHNLPDPNQQVRQQTDPSPLAALNAQLIEARSKTAEAKVRLDQIDAVVASGNPNNAVPAALTSPAINDLREQYSEALQRSEKMKAEYGEEHKAYLDAKADLKRIGDAILVEMKRIAQSYRNEYEVALATEKSLNEQIARQQHQDLGTSHAAVQLAELQRQAESARASYQALLDSSNQIARQGTVPVTEARIIENAQPPVQPAWPQKKLVLALAGGFGLIAGLGLVLLRDMTDDRIRSQEMLERTTQRHSLGVVPRLRLPTAAGHAGRLPRGVRGRFALPSARRQDRTINPMLLQPFLKALADPFSPQVEVMRAINVFLASRQRSRGDADAPGQQPRAHVVSFASLGPGEGKTTVSALFATYLAQNGVKVLLIDADYRRPGLTRTLAPYARAGIFEIDAMARRRRESGEGEASLGAVARDIGCTAFDGMLRLLPGRVHSQPGGLVEELLGGLLKRLIAQFEREVRVIIVDLPPALTLPDTPAVSELFDDIFLVAEWGGTDEQTVQAAIDHSQSFYNKVSGTLLNKVKLDELTSYGRSESVRIGYYS